MLVLIHVPDEKTLVTWFRFRVRGGFNPSLSFISDQIRLSVCYSLSHVVLCFSLTLESDFVIVANILFYYSQIAHLF